MKKIRNVLMVVLSIVIVSAWSLPKSQMLKFEDVASVQVVQSLRGVKGSPLFEMKDEKGKTTIAKVVRWINASTPLGTPKDYGKVGYPESIRIVKNDGKEIMVTQAFKCDFLPLSNVTLKKCSTVKDEIVLEDGSNKIQAKSPELFEWLQNGWKQEQVAESRHN